MGGGCTHVSLSSAIWPLGAPSGDNAPISIEAERKLRRERQSAAGKNALLREVAQREKQERFVWRRVASGAVNP
jgi:hypothetical protein